MPKCDNPGAFRYTWPGKDEAAVCAIHSIGLSRVANAIGLHLQMSKLTLDDYMKKEWACSQEVEEDSPHV